MKYLHFFLSSFLVTLLMSVATVAQTGEVESIDEAKLKSDFDTFISSLNPVNIENKYPEALRKLRSDQPKEQLIGLRVLGESEDIDSLPWVLPLADSSDPAISQWSYAILDKIIGNWALQRRDSAFPHIVVLKPIERTQDDMRQLAWLALKFMRSGNSSQIGCGIRMANNLNLYEFENEILIHKNSLHPAITNAVKYTVERFKNQKLYEAGTLAKPK